MTLCAKARVLSSPCLGLYRAHGFAAPSFTFAQRWMHSHRDQKLLGFTKEQFFSVVADVGSYNKFLPWVTSTRIISQDGSNLIADVEVGFKMYRESWVSRVTLNPHTEVTAVADSNKIFKHLVTHWKFEDGPIDNTVLVSFFVEFEFQSKMYQQVAGVFFTEAQRHVVKSFKKRCQHIYGKK